ncbi:MAG: NAD(P)-binding domain-containing protein [Proteobacteria bacterium]|nr:NAD(P)-binding domain-containing protein [Pseudomonadota bacterium]
MAEPILIWGAGAIGGTLAAYWTRAGQQVLMVDIIADHARACREQGLRITGPVEEFQQIIPATTPEELTGQYPIIVLAVKAHHTATALEQLKPHLTEDGFVLSAQNGLNEILIGQEIGEERTMGCFVNFGADWHGPGEILFGNRGTVVVGELDGSIRDRTQDMFKLLQIFEPDAILSEDVWAYLWGKLGYGAMLFGTALTNESMSDNFANDKFLSVWISLGQEVMAVAHARGVSPKGFNGFDPKAFLPGAKEKDSVECISNLAEFNRHTAKTHSGIWRDLAVRKRATEVDMQIKIIADIGAEEGVNTPALRCLVDLIHDIEHGKREQSEETLQILAEKCT